MISNAGVLEDPVRVWFNLAEMKFTSLMLPTVLYIFFYIPSTPMFHAAFHHKKMKVVSKPFYTIRQPLLAILTTSRSRVKVTPLLRSEPRVLRDIVCILTRR